MLDPTRASTAPGDRGNHEGGLNILFADASVSWYASGGSPADPPHHLEQVNLLAPAGLAPEPHAVPPGTWRWTALWLLGLAGALGWCVRLPRWAAPRSPRLGQELLRAGAVASVPLTLALLGLGGVLALGKARPEDAVGTLLARAEAFLLVPLPWAAGTTLVALGIGLGLAYRLTAGSATSTRVNPAVTRPRARYSPKPAGSATARTTSLAARTPATS